MRPILAFDDTIHGASDQYSSSFFHLLLGELNAFAIQAVIEGANASLSNLEVQLETSGDGRNWVSKNPLKEIDTTVSSGATYSFSGYDYGLRPGLGMVRLRVKLANSSATAHVKVWVREADLKIPFPLTISGCKLFLRADLGLTFVSADEVTRWRDLSGNGDATQATVGRYPKTTSATKINGQAVLHFDAGTATTEKYFNLSSLSALTAAHIFLIKKNVADIPPDNRRSGLWRIGSSGSQCSVPWTDDNIYDDAASTIRYNTAGGIFSPNMTTPHCYEVQSASGSWSSYVSGTQVLSNPGNTVGFFATPTLGQSISAPTCFLDGYVAEMLIYNRILTTSERAALVKYLNNRYALSMT